MRLTWTLYIMLLLSLQSSYANEESFTRVFLQSMQAIYLTEMEFDLIWVRNLVQSSKEPDCALNFSKTKSKSWQEKELLCPYGHINKMELLSLENLVLRRPIFQYFQTLFKICSGPWSSHNHSWIVELRDRRSYQGLILSQKVMNKRHHQSHIAENWIMRDPSDVNECYTDQFWRFL